MNMELIRVLDAMLMDLNVSKAAERLGLSQSGMSHALARLRRELDDPLFVKVAAGMAPTPRALELAPLVGAAMSAARAIYAPVDTFRPQHLERTFSVILTDLGETVFLPPILARLAAEAPLCSVRSLQISPDKVLAALESGEADLALGHLRWQPEGLRQQPLFKEPLRCVGRRGHPRLRPGWSMADYFDCAHVVVSLSGDLSDAYDHVPGSIRVKRRVVATTPHWLAVPKLLQGTDYVATVPSPLAESMALDGYEAVEPPFSLVPFDLRQYWHPRFHTDPVLQWFRQNIQELFAGSGAGGHRHRR